MSNLHPDAANQSLESTRTFGVFLAASLAMIGSFGAWRRGFESLGVGDSASFAVAIVADVVLISILLISEAVWAVTTRVRVGVSRSEMLGAIASLGVKIGVLYLYGWISLRGGGDWWDLY